MPAMLPTLPDLIVEFAPTNAPLDTAPTWVDISAYARVNPQLDTRRGRTAEGVAFSYGTMTLTLSNRDRRFDPLYSAGPYFGNLKPRKQIRVRAVWSATSYTIFTGWVSGWPQDYADGRVDATVTIECIDALAWLAEAGLSIDTVREAVAAYGIIADHSYVVGSTITDSSGNVTASAGGSFSLGPVLRPGGSSSVNIGGVNNGQWFTPSPGFKTSPTNHTLSMWIQWAPGADVSTEFVINCGTGVHIFRMDISAQSIVVQGASRPSATLAYSLRDGLPHHMVWTSTDRTGGTLGKLRAYIDGVFIAQFDTAFSDNPNSSDNMGWGGSTVPMFGIAAPGTTRYEISISDVVLFINAMSDAQVLALYQAYVGQVVESTSARCTRILDNVGWPAAWRTLPPSSGLGVSRGLCSDVQQTGFALNALRVVEATEQGRLFASKSNFLTLQARYDAFETTRGNTVQATLSDDGSDIAYESFGWDYDDRDVLNDVSVNWSDGLQRSTDSTSIAAVGRQSRTITTVLSTQAQATDMAAGVVGQRKDPAMRTRGIRVQPAVGASWATILNLEIGDRIRVEATPMGVGSQLVQTLTLEAISWRITGDQWVCELYGSPIPTDVFVLDSSLLDTGRLSF